MEGVLPECQGLKHSRPRLQQAAVVTQPRCEAAGLGRTQQLWGIALHGSRLCGRLCSVACVPPVYVFVELVYASQIPPHLLGGGRNTAAGQFVLYCRVRGSRRVSAAPAAHIAINVAAVGLRLCK